MKTKGTPNEAEDERMCLAPFDGRVLELDASKTREWVSNLPKGFQELDSDVWTFDARRVSSSFTSREMCVSLMSSHLRVEREPRSVLELDGRRDVDIVLRLSLHETRTVELDGKNSSRAVFTAS